MKLYLGKDDNFLTHHPNFTGVRFVMRYEILHDARKVLNGICHCEYGPYYVSLGDGINKTEDSNNQLCIFGEMIGIRMYKKLKLLFTARPPKRLIQEI